MKKNILRYSITSAVGLLFVFAIVAFKNIFSQNDAGTVLRILCDAFFVPGVCLACVGLIMFASKGGAFDMLGYAFIMIFDALRRDVTKRKYKDFYEYRQAKKESKPNVSYMLIVGGVFIAVSLIILVAYYNVG